MIFRETINAAIAWFVKARRISVVRLCFPVEAARLADKSEEIQTANNRSAEYGNQQVGKWGWADKLDGELRLSTWLWILTCEEPRNTQFLEEPGKVASEGFFLQNAIFYYQWRRATMLMTYAYLREIHNFFIVRNLSLSPASRYQHFSPPRLKRWTLILVL